MPCRTNCRRTLNTAFIKHSDASSDLDAAFAEIRDARSYADLEAARVALVVGLGGKQGAKPTGMRLRPSSARR